MQIPWVEGRQQPESDLVVDGIFRPPRILITLTAYQKLFAYVAASPIHEVLGLGTVERMRNDFLITDVFTLKQTVTPASADMDDGALHHLIYEIVRAGRSPKELMLQWHSHVNMPAYYSPKDLGLIAAYQCDAMISLVVNRRGEYHCRLDLYQPVRIGFAARLHVLIPPPDSEMLERCRADIARNVVVAPWWRTIASRTRKKLRRDGEKEGIELDALPGFPIDVPEAIFEDTPPPPPKEGQP